MARLEYCGEIYKPFRRRYLVFLYARAFRHAVYISLVLVSLVSFISLSHSFLNYLPIILHYRKMPPDHRHVCACARVRARALPFVLFSIKIYYYHIISFLREHIAKRYQECAGEGDNLKGNTKPPEVRGKFALQSETKVWRLQLYSLALSGTSA